MIIPSVINKEIIENENKKNPVVGPQLHNIVETVSSPGILTSMSPSPIKLPIPTSAS